MSKKFKILWSSAHPLSTIIKEGQGRFNKGFSIEGTKMLLPVNYAAPTTVAAGVYDFIDTGSGDGENDALTPTVTNGFGQAVYEYTHLRNAMWLANSEERLLVGGSRGNLLEGKTNQLMEDFKAKVSVGLASANAGARTTLMGLRQVTSTSNTVGGIAQADNTWWQGGVTASAGPFMLDLLDNEYDRINALGRNKADLVLASYASGANVYGKIRSAIAPAERIVDANFNAKYGFTTFEYLDMKIAQDNRLGTALSGSAMVLSTRSWYMGGDAAPKAQPVERLQGTSIKEFYYDWWLAVGCDDPASNSLITGIT